MITKKINFAVLSGLLLFPVITLADFSGTAGLNYYQPKKSSFDSVLHIELDVKYSHQAGPYAGFWFESYDLLEGNDFEKESWAEVYLGYTDKLNSVLDYDFGFLYGQPLDDEWGRDYTEFYLGGRYDSGSNIYGSAYIYHDLESEADSTQLELYTEYTGLEWVGFFAEYITNLQDSDQMTTLELGIGKEALPQTYITGSFVSNLNESDYSYYALKCFYEF